MHNYNLQNVFGTNSSQVLFSISQKLPAQSDILRWLREVPTPNSFLLRRHDYANVGSQVSVAK